MTKLGSWLFPVLLLAATPESLPQSTPSGTADISGELAKLNQAVREIADLLAKQSEGQKLDLLMKRLDLASAKATQLEQRQRSLQAEKTSIEDQRNQIDGAIKEFQAQAQTQASESRRPELQAAVDRAEIQLKGFASRLQSLSQEIAETETQLAAQREELKEWQRTIDRRLSGL